MDQCRLLGQFVFLFCLIKLFYLVVRMVSGVLHHVPQQDISGKDWDRGRIAKFCKYGRSCYQFRESLTTFSQETVPRTEFTYFLNKLHFGNRLGTKSDHASFSIGFKGHTAKIFAIIIKICIVLFQMFINNRILRKLTRYKIFFF